MLAWVAPASPQSQEFSLDESDTWVPAQPPQDADAPEPGSDRAIMIDARRALAADRPGEAQRAMDDWIPEHDGTDNPHLPEAYLIRADAQLAQTYEYKSLFDYEHLIRNYPQSEEFLVAVEREYDIATRYLNGMRKRFLGMRVIDAEEIAIELLIRVQERVPGSQLAERAAIDLADHYYRKREMRLARDAYELYLLNYPQGPNRMHAEKRLIYADVARFKGPRYDSSGLLDARIRIRNFAARYPIEAETSGVNEGLVARIDESMAAQLLESARWYDTQDDDAAVSYTLGRLVRQYPRTIAAAEATDILDTRGWLDDLRAPAGETDDAPIIIEGPGSEQVRPIGPGERLDAPPEGGSGPGDGQDTPNEGGAQR